MTPSQLRTWRQTWQFTRPEAAQLLGLSSTQIYRLEKGMDTIRRQTTLLTQLLDTPEMIERCKMLVGFFRCRQGRRKKIADVS